MKIRIRETGALVTEQEFRAMFPNTGFERCYCQTDFPWSVEWPVQP